MTHTISNIIDLTNAPTPPRWFEFLLEPGRLQQHLETSGCDPSPTQLITLFFRNIPVIESNNINSPSSQKSSPVASQTNGNSPAPATQTNDEPKTVNEGAADKIVVDIAVDSTEVHIPPDSYEAKYRKKKAYALQTLALKVASFLKWDLDTICNNLTIPVQYKLVLALTSACSSKDCPTEVQKFADIIYYHWFLRSAITYQQSTLQPQFNNTTIIYLSQLQQQQQAADTSALISMGELFGSSSKQLDQCFTELNTYLLDLTHNKDLKAKRMKSVAHPFKKAKLSRPCIDCFDSRDEQFNDWDKCEAVETKEFLEAACYDLGRFLFFQEQYGSAKHTLEIIKDSGSKFSKLSEYLQSATHLLEHSLKKENGQQESNGDIIDSETNNQLNERLRTEKYLFDCMTEFSKSQKKDIEMEVEEGENEGEDDFEEDSDLRFEQQLNQQRLPENSAWYLRVPDAVQQKQLLEASKGEVLMAQGNFKQAMGCFVGALMLMTDYFRFFSKNYTEEEPCISRMIQCSITLSCFTQAVALCQMTRNLNYTIAFKQLNERVCNDCCDDIYECIWNVTLLEYIINLHSKRGEVERRTRATQLLGQLELNENNPEEILREAEQVRRSRFFRIISNKYL